MRTRIIPLTLLAVSQAAFVIHAQSQTPPDAGTLRQQIERDMATQLPSRSNPDKPATPTSMKPVAGILLTVKEFRLAGNTLLSTARLLPVLAPWLHRPVGFAELQEAAAAVTNAYSQAGWVVRTFLPEQDIKNGIVTLQIVEAVFGTSKIEGLAAARVATSQIIRNIDAQQKAGAPLNADALDRALLLVDDLPGVAVSGSLQEGKGERETDLLLKLADEPLSVGEVALDNTGSRSTGELRVSANLNINSPLGLGDLLSGNAVHTEGSNYIRIGLTLPVGPYGWRVGANASHLGYRLTAPEFAALDGKGSSDSTGIEASYPLVRTRLKNLYAALNYDHKTFNNESGGASTTRYEVDALAFALNGNYFDNLGGGGANGASLALVLGRLNLDGSPNQAGDASSTQAAGTFTKLRLNFSRQQVLTDDLAFFVALAGQWANKNLDSSEKFYLGGSGGVRAYPSNEGSGALGQMANLELRWRVAKGWTLSGFYDWGQVTVNRNNNFLGAAALNNYSLQGAGLALMWQENARINVRAAIARRIGDNPNPTVAGNDQDGSLTKNRLWLTVILPF